MAILPSQSLDVSHNYLNGQLTMDFTPMTALTQLVMSFNNINGGLPPSLGNLPQVCVRGLCPRGLEAHCKASP